jgi:tRNA-specific 2-thiouridylase
VVRLDAARGRVVVGPRAALRTTRILLRDMNWIGEGALDVLLAEGPLDTFVKVRSTRPPQPATLTRGADGFELELAGGEEGVAPGQACVLYDAGSGQARMLGGGFIRAAASQSEHTMPPTKPRKLRVTAR